MNVTDLRITFKMDTGRDPLWAKTHDGKDLRGTSWQKGWPRTIYGLWLEVKIGKTKYLRDRYFQVKKEKPTKWYHGKSTEGGDVLHGDYIEWLEIFLIHFKDEYPI